ncbi:MAG: element excision factor XisH family protein [Leptolyngbyaceae bacterium]|nr:element excision factor XisH family protein [Leptolyngbyaceae bacterium]
MDEVDFEIDLAAETLIAAVRQQEKIAVEGKSFIASSNISDFHTALGQFLNRVVRKLGWSTRCAGTPPQFSDRSTAI